MVKHTQFSRFRLRFTPIHIHSTKPAVFTPPGCFSCIETYQYTSYSCLFLTVLTPLNLRIFEPRPLPLMWPASHKRQSWAGQQQLGPCCQYLFFTWTSCEEASRRFGVNGHRDCTWDDRFYMIVFGKGTMCLCFSMCWLECGIAYLKVTTALGGGRWMCWTAQRVLMILSV